MLSLALMGPANPATGQNLTNAAQQALAEAMNKKELRLRPREILTSQVFGLLDAQSWLQQMKQRLLWIHEIGLEEDKIFLVIVGADVFYPAHLYLEIETFAQKLTRLKPILLPRLVVDLVGQHAGESSVGIISETTACDDNIYAHLLANANLQAVYIPYAAVEKSRKKPVHSCNVMILVEGGSSSSLYKGTTLMVDPAEVIKQALPALLGFV